MQADHESDIARIGGSFSMLSLVVETFYIIPPVKSTGNPGNGIRMLSLMSNCFTKNCADQPVRVLQLQERNQFISYMRHV